MPTTITDEASAATLEPAFAKTTGAKEAMVAFALLLKALVVTVAWSNPAMGGLVENVTLSEVGVASAMVPTAPPTNATELSATSGSNPKPVMMTKLALTGIMFAEFEVTTGVTVAN
jgi:hypothetical protein